MLAERNLMGNNDLYNTMPTEDFFEKQMLSHQEQTAWEMQANQISAHKEEMKEPFNLQTMTPAQTRFNLQTQKQMSADRQMQK